MRPDCWIPEWRENDARDDIRRVAFDVVHNRVLERAIPVRMVAVTAD
jgi:hypothetical protein